MKTTNLEFWIYALFFYTVKIVNLPIFFCFKNIAAPRKRKETSEKKIGILDWWSTCDEPVRIEEKHPETKIRIWLLDPMGFLIYNSYL